MKGALLPLALVAAEASAGEGMLGTKGAGASALPTASPTGTGLPPIASVLVALAVVLFLLKVVLPRIVRFGGSASGDAIRVEASTPLAGGHLHIVTARGRTLLVGASSQGFRTLAMLDEATVEAPFMDVLEAAQPFQPVPAAASDATELLRRLDRLAPESA